MSYMQKLEQLAQTNLDIGFNAGFQAATDLWMLALAQEGFGPGRMWRTAHGVAQLYREFGHAWRNEPESDYAQEQIDRVLKPLCGEEFVPFRERNEWVRKLKYGKGAKK